MKNKWKTILITTPLLIATPLLLTTTISCNEKVEEQQPHIQGTEEQPQPQETEPFAYVEISNCYVGTPNSEGGYTSWLDKYKFEVYTKEVFSQKWEVLETFYLSAFNNNANEENIRNELFDIFEKHFYIDRKDFITLKNIWKSLKFNYNNNENPYKN